MTDLIPDYNVLFQLYFGCALARFYIAFSLLGFCCVTGMSYMFRKSVLDQLNGLGWYGRYLAEDFFLTKAMHERSVLSRYIQVGRLTLHNLYHITPHKLCRFKLQGVSSMQCFVLAYSEGSQSLQITLHPQQITAAISTLEPQLNSFKLKP